MQREVYVNAYWQHKVPFLWSDATLAQIILYGLPVASHSGCITLQAKYSEPGLTTGMDLKHDCVLNNYSMVSATTKANIVLNVNTIFPWIEAIALASISYNDDSNPYL